MSEQKQTTMLAIIMVEYKIDNAPANIDEIRDIEQGWWTTEAQKVIQGLDERFQAKIDHVTIVTDEEYNKAPWTGKSL